jgi:hypothetical protein
MGRKIGVPKEDYGHGKKKPETEIARRQFCGWGAFTFARVVETVLVWEYICGAIWGSAFDGPFFDQSFAGDGSERARNVRER